METSFSPHSAFSLDCCQTTKVLMEQTPRSLCLIDEFGKGTAPVDGMALLAACVHFFAQRSTKCLFVLHFTEILSDEIINLLRYPNIETFKMVVHQELNSEDDKDDLVTPLYKLQIGVSDSSGGIYCAKIAGVPADICDRAQEIKQCLDARTVIPLRKSKKRLALGEISNLLLLKQFFSPTTYESGKENKWATATGTIHYFIPFCWYYCYLTSYCLFGTCKYKFL
jgi:DNA mismatch repair ATPase MutS